MPDASRPWYSEVPRSTRGATFAGIFVVALLIGGFGVWGSTAPIAGAVIAPGVFVTNGQNKTIQHLEGGVIREILVREGDVVEPGQLLVQLDDTSARAEMRRHMLKRVRLEAIEARLDAEVKQRTTIEFPKIQPEYQADADIAALIRVQTRTFEARKANVANDISGLRKSIDGLDQRIAGGKVQLSSLQQQTKILNEELKGK